jgi:hypothetical protein
VYYGTNWLEKLCMSDLMIDIFSWSLHQHGQYIVYSLYLALINNGMTNMNKQLWRLKVPLKIKKFMWYLRKEVVLTKDNLVKCSWGDSKQCDFCLHDETTQHLFYDCYYTRFLWELTQIAFSIVPPHSVHHMFNTWTNQVGSKLRRQLISDTSTYY